PPHLHHVERILPPHGVRMLHSLPPLLLNILGPVSKNPYATLSFQSTLIFLAIKAVYPVVENSERYKKDRESGE
ncbi:hypothetical protein, partial [Klebsiella pneumoniae]|uniref:hypothetical protein n=1 Tax=Klebsiella pneumoniae TaxID=573 RepID=UPI00273087C0